MSQTAFTFLLYDDTPTMPFIELDMLENEEAARRRALNLLDESKRFVAVEVSNARGIAFIIERPSALASFAPPPRRSHRLGSARRRPSSPPR